MALSPRSDEDAERIALRRASGLVAPQSEYERIAADLKAIRASRAYPGASGVFHSFGTKTLILWVSASVRDGIRRGRYTGLDCLNWWYGVESVEVLEGLGVVHIRFSGIYNPELLQRSYGGHPDVAKAQPDRRWGAGDDIILCSKTFGGTHRYYFRKGWEDCPGGCVNAAFRAYDVTHSGTVHFVDGWGRTEIGSYESEPDWVESSCLTSRSG
jgi:hypothetical protein